MSATQQWSDGFAHQSASSCLADSRLLAPDFLSQEEEQALEDAMSSPQSVQAGIDLVREGNQSDRLLIVTRGWACRYMTTRGGARQLPVVLVPGDVGNLDAFMFDRVEYGVRTLTQATVVALPRKRALALGERYPAIYRLFTWLALVENATLSRWALSFTRRSAHERLAHLLCELSVRLDAEDGNQSRFEFPLTQEQIGDALGLTSVHVNRTMQRLRGDGLVATIDRTIVLPDVAQLRKVCDFDPRYLHVGSSPTASKKKG
jgi:CRP-like cAMP-binding protein